MKKESKFSAKPIKAKAAESNELPDFIKENPEAPATKGQTWALFCATKEDYRGRGLTRMEAYEELNRINAKNGFVKKARVTAEA